MKARIQRHGFTEREDPNRLLRSEQQETMLRVVQHQQPLGKKISVRGDSRTDLCVRGHRIHHVDVAYQ